MNIGSIKKLYPGLPSPTPVTNESLLKVKLYIPIKPNNSGDIIYESGVNGFQKILNYCQVYRIRDIVRKVFSRQICEQVRNDKWLVCGLGENHTGTIVTFIHPFAQQYQDWIVVPNHLILPTSIQNNIPDTKWVSLHKSEKIDDELCYFATLHPIKSGSKVSIPIDLLSRTESLIKKYYSSAQFPEKHFTESRPFFLIRKKQQASRKQKSALLFGYGNYARTITIPYLRKYLAVDKIHEIDPSLLINTSNTIVSTNPDPDDNDVKFPIWLIASYHHTHTKLAMAAIKNHCTAIVEKPISTNIDDYNQLKHLLLATQGKIFQCFQKRHQIFNEYLYKDFKIKEGEPINYKAIVFEIPLHHQHWYNWPISGSRIISNGCHWIDHFLFLNRYSPYTNFDVHKFESNDILIRISLLNGAHAVITLSDVGSSRLGVREFVELSTHGYRCTIIDSMHYNSESNHRIIRRAHTDKLHSLRIMYDSIGRKISNGENGDTLDSLLSTELSIKINDLLFQKIPLTIDH